MRKIRKSGFPGPKIRKIRKNRKIKKSDLLGPNFKKIRKKT